MAQQSENSDKDSNLDLEDLKVMEEAVILSYIDGSTDEIEEIDEQEVGGILAKIALARMRIEIERDLQNAEDDIFSDRDTNSVDEDVLRKLAESKKIQSSSHMIMNYFVLASALIESMIIDLFKKELIEDEYSETAKTKTIVEHRLDQKLREDLLFRTGIIDQALKSELSHVRGIRNGLVHNFTDYLLLKEIDSVPSELDRVYNTYTDVFDRVSEDSTVSLEVSKTIE